MNSRLRKTTNDKPLLALLCALFCCCGLWSSALGSPLPQLGPKKIVSIGASTTEILYALGEENHIAGIDSSSLLPPQARSSKPNLGYFRMLSTESVLAVSPDYVIAVPTTGPKHVLDALNSLGIPVAIIPETYSEQGIKEKINLIAHIVGKDSKALDLIHNLEKAFQNFEHLVREKHTTLCILYVMSYQNNKIVVGGKGTAIDAMIHLTGHVNAARQVSGYKMITNEDLVRMAPNVILMMNENSQGITAETLFKQPAFSLIPAAHQKALVKMDSSALLSFGLSTPEALTTLYKHLAQFDS